MDLKHVHVARTCTRDMQHGEAAFICSLDIQHWHTPCTVHAAGHVTWMRVDMQWERALCPSNMFWTCSRDMRNRHVACSCMLSRSFFLRTLERESAKKAMAPTSVADKGFVLFIEGIPLILLCIADDISVLYPSLWMTFSVVIYTLDNSSSFCSSFWITFQHFDLSCSCLMLNVSWCSILPWKTITYC